MSISARQRDSFDQLVLSHLSLIKDEAVATFIHQFEEEKEKDEYSRDLCDGQEKQTPQQ